TSTNHAARMGRRPKCPMSAYSASAPVSTRTTAPNRKNPCHPFSAKNRIAYIGSTANRIAGSFMISATPNAAMLANHNSITGPNTLPMRSVPWRWNRNNTNSTSTLSGTTILPNTGVATRKPSIAPSTVIAGVMTPSPYNSAAPNNPSVMRTATGTMPTRPRSPRWMSASSARMPPSPRLSARMMNDRYFTLTTSVSAHTTSDNAPYTLGAVGAIPLDGLKHSLIAYSGLVPMSPNTTPSAVSDMIANLRPLGRCSIRSRSGRLTNVPANDPVVVGGGLPPPASAGAAAPERAGSAAMRNW